MRSLRYLAIALVVLTLLPGAAVTAATDDDYLRSPESGEVYKEFTRFMSGATEWRVTDPFATATGSPGNRPSTFLPNDIMAFDIDDLVGATRAEAVIEVWGGHTGTTGKRFRLNGNAWLTIPELDSPPTRGECYNQQYNVVVDVPLTHLISGSNSLEGTSGRQSCYSFQWGQWGWYQLTVRVYYDPATKPAPAATVVAPAVMGENPTVGLATGDAIDRVDFFAYYDGFDVSGDGDFTTYHHNYARPLYGPYLFQPTHHVGTATASPWEVTWDTTLVPNQPAGSIKLIARVRAPDGTWSVTDELTGLSLDRGTQTVRLYKPKNVPENFWVRAGQNKASQVYIPTGVDLSTVVSAQMLVRTWNGVDGLAEPGEEHYTRVNNWTSEEFGKNHFFGYDIVPVVPSALRIGDNTIRFWSASSHHGREILWPGPALLLRFAGDAPAVCGDLSLDPGEECDDGNVEGLDGCDPDCQIGPVDFLKPPASGEVYRDFTRVITTAGNLWRVTDPGAAGGATAFLPNPPIELDITDLEGATRAQAVVSIWGGHTGTSNKRFRLNGNEWIGLPDLATTPTPGQCYTQQFNAAVDVPLDDLIAGTNVLEGTAGPQTCYSFNWGQWGWYLFTVRVYYDPAAMAHPTGAITNVASGDVLGDDPTIAVTAMPAATGSAAEIERVELYAYHDGYDTDGDGTFREYHHDYHPMVGDTEFLMRNHVGTDDTPPYEITWDTSQVPDQAWKGVRLVARILDADGVWNVTPEIDEVSIQRTGSVRLYKPKNMPETFWVSRRRAKDGFVDIPADHDLTRATSATLHLRTWNGNDGLADPGQIHYIALNSWTLPGIGVNHYYSYDQVEPPVTALVNGSNRLRVYSQSTHHGIELLWPGPGIVVRYDGSIGECGNDILDPNEECDDGNLEDGDTCSSGCLQRVCGDGIVSNGEDCDEGDTEPGDGCDENCRDEVCGNGIHQAGEECDDGNTVDDDACNNFCVLNFCGDGSINNGEDCEDGGIVNGDGCDENCFTEFCGNGIPQTAEQCDDGNNVDDDACNNLCVLNFCGDGSINNGEDCEDGNTANEDGCDENCRIEICGNGVPQFGEECDDGNLEDADSCGNDCVLNFCGDGEQNNGEQCDDGNLNDLDLCSNLCLFTVVCENELINGDLLDGTTGWSFYSDTSANLLPGNGELRVRINTAGSNIQILQAPITLEADTAYRVRLTARNTFENDLTVVLQKHEAPYSSYGLARVFDLTDTDAEYSAEFTTPSGTLDDARLMLFMSPHDQNGTNYYFSDINLEKVEDCPLTVCGNGIPEIGEACDDGLGNSDIDPDACRLDCTDSRCGDGVVDSGETCDEASANSDTDPDACRTDCSIATCGDGVVDAGEQCDDGGTDPGDGCGATCSNENDCGNGVIDTGEDCDDGAGNSDSDPDTCRTDCSLPTCGDGVIDTGEDCDDGAGNSDTDPDSCRTDCSMPICGDGVIDTGEDCDDGAGNSDTDPDTCRADCAMPTCGDGVVDTGEDCDDGNAVDGDVCSNMCRAATGCTNEFTNGDFTDGRSGWYYWSMPASSFTAASGTFVATIGTQTTNAQLYRIDVNVNGSTQYRVRFRARNSLGNDVSVNLFRHSWPFTSYGLGRTFDLTSEWQQFEAVFTTPPGDRSDGRFSLFMHPYDQNNTVYEFDDFSLENLDACQPGICGDGVVDAGEACDNGAGNSDDNADACRLDCSLPTCGDGVQDAGEACDDGAGNSNDSADACRLDCSLPTCGDGVQDAGEACDEGAANSNDSADACRLDCSLPTCGDGVQDAGEACDDGNADETDGCTSACVATTGVVNLIGNGDFESGKAPWFFYSDTDVRFTVVNGEASLRSVAHGSNVQLFHTGFDVLPGRRYRLSFRGRHTTGSDIWVGVLRHTSPYTNYGVIRRVDLGTTMDTHVLEFTTSATATGPPRLMFQVGAFDVNGQTYFIDDVVLELLP